MSASGQSIKITLHASRVDIPAVYAPTNALAPAIADTITRHMTAYLPRQAVTVDTDTNTVYAAPLDVPGSLRQVGTFTVTPNAIEGASA